VLAAILRNEPDWTLLPREVPSEVRTLLQQCLQKEPAQRLHDIAVALTVYAVPFDLKRRLTKGVPTAVVDGVLSNVQAFSPPEAPSRTNWPFAVLSLIFRRPERWPTFRQVR